MGLTGYVGPIALTVTLTDPKPYPSPFIR